MEKKYRLSKINIPEKFCSKIDSEIGIIYLLEDENGKTLNDLFSLKR